jgi:hypothetical protein
MRTHPRAQRCRLQRLPRAAGAELHCLSLAQCQRKRSGTAQRTHRAFVHFCYPLPSPYCVASMTAQRQLLVTRRASLNKRCCGACLKVQLAKHLARVRRSSSSRPRPCARGRIHRHGLLQFGRDVVHSTHEGAVQRRRFGSNEIRSGCGGARAAARRMMLTCLDL